MFKHEVLAHFWHDANMFEHDIRMMLQQDAWIPQTVQIYFAVLYCYIWNVLTTAVPLPVDFWICKAVAEFFG